MIGHHEDRGGKRAVCELFDWIGESIAAAEPLARCPGRRCLERGRAPQFVLQMPRTSARRAPRIELEAVAAPRWLHDHPWRFVDRSFQKIFGIE